MTSGEPGYSIGIVGAGWRALSYIRVGRALPERFHIGGLVVQTQARAEQVRSEWGMNAYATVEDLLDAFRPDFMVLAVPRSATVQWLGRLVAAKVPVLCETPPAADLQGLQALTELVARQGRVQVAEQYQYQPLHAARLALTESGHIGQVSMVSLSVCHDYHAFSLMRRHLRVPGEAAVLTAVTFRSDMEAGPGKTGPRRLTGTVEEIRTIGLVNFGTGFGVYDFADEQYFSYVRSPRVVIRGGSGEMSDHDVRHLRGLDEPVTQQLRREQTGHDGDLGGYSLRGIALGERWVYRNPFPGARLADDEIAIATCLELMGRYCEGGPPFYGVADAAQDHYLSLCLHRAAASGEPVRADPQSWVGALLDPLASRPFPLMPVVEDQGTSKWAL